MPPKSHHEIFKICKKEISRETKLAQLKDNLVTILNGNVIYYIIIELNGFLDVNLSKSKVMIIKNTW